MFTLLVLGLLIAGPGSLALALWHTTRLERILASMHAFNAVLFLVMALWTFSKETSHLTAVPSGVIGIGATNAPFDATFVLKPGIVEVYRKNADGTEVYAPGWNHARVERWMFLWRCEQLGGRCA